MKVRYAISFATLALAATVALAQAPAPPAPAPAPAGPSTASRAVSGIRNKISAADLPSAESILEVYRERQGEDGGYLVALGWLARGALLLGETERAGELNAELRRLCDARLARGPGLAQDDSLETALGASIEVEAQRLARARGTKAAAEFLRGEIARFPGPVAFRSRLHKRLNMLTLAGQPAPELVVEDHVGAKPASFAALRGRPVVVYLWSASCGDCKAQAASLAHVATRFAGEGLAVVPLTRYYDEDADERVREKAHVDSVWTAVYGGLGPPAIPISTESMQRWGGSSTPTFAFVDRRGVVRGYTPTRLTEAALEREVRALLR